MSRDPVPPKTDRVDDLNHAVHTAIWRATREWDLSIVEVTGVLAVNAAFYLLESWGIDAPNEDDEIEDDPEDDYGASPWCEDDDDD